MNNQGLGWGQDPRQFSQNPPMPGDRIFSPTANTHQGSGALGQQHSHVQLFQRGIPPQLAGRGYGRGTGYFHPQEHGGISMRAPVMPVDPVRMQMDSAQIDERLVQLRARLTQLQQMNDSGMQVGTPSVPPASSAGLQSVRPLDQGVPPQTFQPTRNPMLQLVASGSGSSSFGNARQAQLQQPFSPMPGSIPSLGVGEEDFTPGAPGDSRLKPSLSSGNGKQPVDRVQEPPLRKEVKRQQPAAKQDQQQSRGRGRGRGTGGGRGRGIDERRRGGGREKGRATDLQESDPPQEPGSTREAAGTDSGHNEKTREKREDDPLAELASIWGNRGARPGFRVVESQGSQDKRKKNTAECEKQRKEELQKLQMKRNRGKEQAEDLAPKSKPATVEFAKSTVLEIEPLQQPKLLEWEDDEYRYQATVDEKGEEVVTKTQKPRDKAAEQRDRWENHHALARQKKEAEAAELARQQQETEEKEKERKKAILDGQRRINKPKERVVRATREPKTEGVFLGRLFDEERGSDGNRNLGAPGNSSGTRPNTRTIGGGSGGARPPEPPAVAVQETPEQRQSPLLEKQTRKPMPPAALVQKAPERRQAPLSAKSTRKPEQKKYTVDISWQNDKEIGDLYAKPPQKKVKNYVKRLGLQQARIRELGLPPDAPECYDCAVLTMHYREIRFCLTDHMVYGLSCRNPNCSMWLDRRSITSSKVGNVPCGRRLPSKWTHVDLEKNAQEKEKKDEKKDGAADCGEEKKAKEDVDITKTDAYKLSMNAMSMWDIKSNASSASPSRGRKSTNQSPGRAPSGRSASPYSSAGSLSDASSSSTSTASSRRGTRRTGTSLRSGLRTHESVTSREAWKKDNDFLAEFPKNQDPKTYNWDKDPNFVRHNARNKKERFSAYYNYYWVDEERGYDPLPNVVVKTNEPTRRPDPEFIKKELNEQNERNKKVLDKLKEEQTERRKVRTERKKVQAAQRQRQQQRQRNVEVPTQLFNAAAVQFRGR